jgi:branched-chain amino acid transport system substrate-binding protein
MANRIMRETLRNAALPLAALMFAGGAAAETVKVGVVLPFSGSSADVAQSELRAMKLYLKLHKAELGKHEIQLIERDSEEPSGASALALTRELLTSDRVDILVGYQYSPDAIASAPIRWRAMRARK